MIPFAAYTAAETPSAFQWTGQLPKITPSRGRSWFPSNIWFPGPKPVSPQMASRSV